MRYAFWLSTASVSVILLAGLAFAQHGRDGEAAHDMALSASQFLASLTSEQRTVANLPFQGDERYNFHYIPRERKGISYKMMTPAQRQQATALLATGLSHRGARQALQIMFLEQILFEKEGRDIRDPEGYFFTVFGEPGGSGAWGYRVEGHHLSLNYTVRDGHVASTSPAFLGTNPAIIQDGSNAGMRVLADEEVLGRALYTSFDQADRKTVRIEVEAPSDIITTSSRRAEIGEPRGLRYAEMSDAQKEAVFHLLGVYAYRMRPDLAASEIARIESTGLDDVRFAWAGGAEPGEPHYYRIQGPTFLVEYDNTQNGANHIHSVWRDLEADWGDVDPLTDHYARSHQPKKPDTLADAHSHSQPHPHPHVHVRDTRPAQ